MFKCGIYTVYYVKIEVDSYDSLYNVMIYALNQLLIKIKISIDQKIYYYNIFLEKGSCQLAKK